MTVPVRVGIDYDSPLPLPTVRALGASFVIRYTSTLTAAEARMFAEANIDLVLIYESDGHSYIGGQPQGELEAHQALSGAIDSGMVGAHPIFFAPADVDISATPAVTDEYLRGVASVLPVSRIGLYGGYAHVHHALDSKLVGWGYQTTAWSAGVWDDRAVLRQVSYHSGYDIDWATVEEFGQWRPGVPVAPKKPVPDLAYLLPVERAAVNRYEDLKRHPEANRRAVAKQLAVLVGMRKAVWRAAVEGIDPGGVPTEKGWDALRRRERYTYLRLVTGFPLT